MPDKVYITLQDAETGKVYDTFVSSEDAHRIKTDIVFAYKTLRSLKKSQGEPEPSSSASTASMISTAEAETPESEQDSAFKWSHRAILLLIEEYRKREEDIISGKVSQKRVWNLISDVLCNHGHDVTGPQCQSKFNGMKRTFKSIKDHNSKSGNNPRSWPYTEVMESLLGEKPFMNPVALASSTNRACTESEGDTSSLDSYDTAVSVGPSNSCKRKNTQIGEAILKSRKISEDGRKMTEENKSRRHEQTMNQRAEMIQALNKLIDKLQVKWHTLKQEALL